MEPQIAERLKRERIHAKKNIAALEQNWGFVSPAGQVRYSRRVDFLTAIPVRSDGKVVEIGAGTGAFSEALARKFPNLISTDVSHDLMILASKRFPTLRFATMDAHHLDFPDGTLDAIVGCAVLHHLDWNIALKTFSSKLKSGGVIRFSEPNLANPQIYLQKNISILKKLAGDSEDEYAFTAGQIRRSLRSAGFSQVDVRPYEFLHPATPKSWIGSVEKLEGFLSRTFLKHIGGSLLIHAVKA